MILRSCPCVSLLLLVRFFSHFPSARRWPKAKTFGKLSAAYGGVTAPRRASSPPTTPVSANIATRPLPNQKDRSKRGSTGCASLFPLRRDQETGFQERRLVGQAGHAADRRDLDEPVRPAVLTYWDWAIIPIFVVNPACYGAELKNPAVSTALEVFWRYSSESSDGSRARL